jgi:hypothetical protein
MSHFNNEEIYQEIISIVSKYDLFECYQCAKEVMKWLKIKVSNFYLMN